MASMCALPASRLGGMQRRRAAFERSIKILHESSQQSAAAAVQQEVTADAQSSASGRTSAQPRALLTMLKDPLARAQLHVGATLQIIQQLCGINTVMYFTPVILQMAGYADRQQALLWACLPAGCNALGTVIGALQSETMPLPLCSCFSARHKHCHRCAAICVDATATLQQVLSPCSPQALAVMCQMRVR